jgi:hypothetical protein
MYYVLFEIVYRHGDLSEIDEACVVLQQGRNGTVLWLSKHSRWFHEYSTMTSSSPIWLHWFIRPSCKPVVVHSYLWCPLPGNCAVNTSEFEIGERIQVVIELCEALDKVRHCRVKIKGYGVERRVASLGVKICNLEDEIERFVGIIVMWYDDHWMCSLPCGLKERERALMMRVRTVEYCRRLRSADGGG